MTDTEAIIRPDILEVLDTIEENTKLSARDGEAFPWFHFIFRGVDVFERAMDVGMKQWGFSEMSRTGAPQTQGLNVIVMPLFMDDLELLEHIAKNAQGKMRNVIEDLGAILIASAGKSEEDARVKARYAVDALEKVCHISRNDFHPWLHRKMVQDLKPDAIAVAMESWLWRPPEGLSELEVQRLKARNQKEHGPSYGGWPGRIRALSIYLETPEAHVYRHVEIIPTDEADPTSPAKDFRPGPAIGPMRKDASNVRGRMVRYFDPPKQPWREVPLR